jgi:stage II sporulation protein M
MRKQKTKLIDIILPSKKINFFVVTILVLGLISGSIFLITLNNSDKSNTISQIQTFISNVNNSSINNGLALKNSLIINYLFVGIIWILGFSIIGIMFNIFLTYIKGFVVGFSISSMVLVYKYKALPLALLYIFPSQVLNILVVCVLTIYSIMFTLNLLKIIVTKKKNNNLILKRYFVILVFSIIISFISSILEVYLFPNLLKIIISLYVS